MLLHAEATQTVLHDDDGTVDDQAEIQCAKAHQVSRDPVLDHAGDGHQHGERDYSGRDQRSANVTEQQK